MKWTTIFRRTATMMVGTKTVELNASANANQVDQLKQQLQALDAQRGQLDQKRSETAAALQRAKDSRASTVESLSTVAGDKQVHIHKTIDSMDGVICEKSRILEGLGAAIAKLGQELAGVHAQYTAAQEQAQREQQARDSETAQAQLAELEATTARLGDEFVEALARLNIAAAKHAERGTPQSNFANVLVEKFVTRQRSRGGHGWEYAPGILPNLVLEIRPLLPPGAKP
jgi:chromosome segregation ATPase